ncbi:hypothetical protein [Pelobacter propionicus]|nr:hypothetical protein [Pelobacter propionicus]
MRRFSCGWQESFAGSGCRVGRGASRGEGVDAFRGDYVDSRQGEAGRMCRPPHHATEGGLVLFSRLPGRTITRVRSERGRGA